MSYLNQLKQQANTIEAEKKTTAQSEKELTDTYHHKVRPVLKKTFQYFYQVTQQLATIKPKIAVDYKLEGIGQLLGLYQDDYILSNYDKKKDSFYIRIFAHSDIKQRFEINNESEVEQYKDYLWKHNIKFKHQQINNSKSKFLRTVFKLQGEIIAQINFKGDYENMAIEIHTQNFPDLGTQTYIYPPAEFNDIFLDKMTMFITRTDSTNILLKQYEKKHSWIRYNDKMLQRMEALEKLKQQNIDKKNIATSQSKPTTDIKKTETGFFKRLFGK